MFGEINFAGQPFRTIPPSPGASYASEAIKWFSEIDSDLSTLGADDPRKDDLISWGGFSFSAGVLAIEAGIVILLLYPRPGAVARILPDSLRPQRLTRMRAMYLRVIIILAFILL